MLPPDSEVRSALARARTIAVVGLSDNPDRDSHSVAQYLQRSGYRIVPVNPTLREALGEPAYPSLSAVPAPIHIDIADVFRRSDQVPPIVEEALARPIPVIWMQLGVESPAAARQARAAGATVVENRCIRTEHQRLGIPRRAPES